MDIGLDNDSKRIDGGRWKMENAFAFKTLQDLSDAQKLGDLLGL